MYYILLVVLPEHTELWLFFKRDNLRQVNYYKVI